MRCMAKREKTPRPAKNEDIQNVVIKAVGSDRYRLSAHVLERMCQRKVTIMDIKDALLDGRREKKKDCFDELKGGWSYAFRGKLEDGRELRIPVSEYENGIIIISAIDLTNDD